MKPTVNIDLEDFKVLEGKAKLWDEQKANADSEYKYGVERGYSAMIAELYRVMETGRLTSDAAMNCIGILDIQRYQKIVLKLQKPSRWLGFKI